MTAEHDEKVCPLGNVHRRMDDAHTLWHQAHVNYFDPDGFRVALQSCIQALRSVTWLLQNHKAEVPDFEPWYAGWQGRMRADPIMRWLVDARNQIEKRGDLDSRSQISAHIIASYLDPQPTLPLDTELFEEVKATLARIPKKALDEQVLEHGVLKIERRWVANNLPEAELLDALAHVYGQLSLLVDDCHRQLGLPVPVTMVAHEGEFHPAPGGGPADGRLPCMVVGDEQRSLLLSLKTGAHLELTRRSVMQTEEKLEKAGQRYGPIDEIRPAESPKTLRDVARFYFSMARRISEGWLSLVDGVPFSRT